MHTVTTIGLDIAKSVFQVHGVDADGLVVIRRQLKRRYVLAFFEKLSPCLVGIEACASSHHWSRELQALGRTVRLMPPAYVKLYIKSQKNDAADAEAICEAVQRPTMRFVPVKSAEQQAVLLLHRTRDLLIRQRSSLISAMLAHFAEFGIVIHRRVRDIDRLLLLLGETQEGLPELAREMLGIFATQLREIDGRIQVVEARLMTWHRSNEVSCRLATIPGVGPITASAIVATIADARQFKSGRQFAAWLGLVPQQRSSGGKERLGGISKRGDGYIRRLMIHGARAIVGWRKRSPRTRDHWIDGLLGRRHINVATVALANKSARVAWALMVRESSYNHRLARAA